MYLKSILNLIPMLKTCALSQNQRKMDNSANKPKFVYITINNRLPRCQSTIKGVWGYTNHQDVARYKFWKEDQIPKHVLPHQTPALH